MLVQILCHMCVCVRACVRHQYKLYITVREIVMASLRARLAPVCVCVLIENILQFLTGFADARATLIIVIVMIMRRIGMGLTQSNI